MAVLVPWNSRVPDAIDALVSLLKQATANTDITIHDGPFLGGGSSTEFIQIGWPGFTPGYEYPSRSMSEETGSTSVSGTTAQVGLAPGGLETFNIACVSLVRFGDTDEVSQARRQSYANIAYVGQVLQGPKWLNGTVQRAVMGATASWFPVQDRRGLLSAVVFTVKCDAWAQQ